jgi:hypothetical protein
MLLNLSAPPDVWEVRATETRRAEGRDEMAWWIVGTAHLGTDTHSVPRATQPHLSRRSPDVSSGAGAEVESNNADAVV